MFDKATRIKLRFESTRGALSVEELWDLPLRGKLSLDSLAKVVSRQIKSETGESFVDSRSTVDTTQELRLDILKHIIGVKLAEESASREAAEKREKNARIRELIAQKQDQELAGKSIEELTEMLAK